jgi:hypothetical protein
MHQTGNRNIPFERKNNAASLPFVSGLRAKYQCINGFNKARLEVRSARGPPATKWLSAGGLDKSEPEIET